MSATYIVTHDLANDTYNWASAAKSPISHGLNWYYNLDNDADRKMFKNLQNLPSSQSKPQLKQYIQGKVQNKDFIMGQRFIQKCYEQNFQKACKWLEKVTKRPLAFSKYTIYLTTFPRAPYSPDDGSLFFYYRWINPIANFMHEALHIQFHRYWRDDPESPVSKLSDQDWEFLKESLTVILNKKYVNFVELDDHGYDAHQEFRKKLWECWEKEQDFDKLVEYGVGEATKITKK